MIGALLGESASATFAAPFRLIFSIYTLGWILAQYLSPQFSQDAIEGGGRHWSNYLSGFLVCGALVGLATYGAAPWLVDLVYGSAFPESATLLRMLSPTIFLDAGVACLGTILVMQNRGVASALAIGCACLASAVVLLLYAHHDVYAAVYAKFAGYLALLLAQLIILLSAKPIR
jgi:O-antigen/teichoic acid export membrane protein